MQNIRCYWLLLRGAIGKPTKKPYTHTSTSRSRSGAADQEQNTPTSLTFAPLSLLASVKLATAPPDTVAWPGGEKYRVYSFAAHLVMAGRGTIWCRSILSRTNYSETPMVRTDRLPVTQHVLLRKFTNGKGQGNRSKSKRRARKTYQCQKQRLPTYGDTRNKAFLC